MARIKARAKPKVKRTTPKKKNGVGDAGVMTAKLRATL